MQSLREHDWVGISRERVVKISKEIEGLHRPEHLRLLMRVPKRISQKGE
jgi:hypothetical protein